VCKDEFTCLGGCRPDNSSSVATESCRYQCKREPKAATDALMACRATYCATECGMSCGGMFGAYLKRLVSRSYGCRDCLAQSCAQATACSQSTTCLAAVACRENCSPFDLACINDCQAIDPPDVDGGTSLSQELYSNITNTCTGDSACAFGSQWSCLGQVTWPVSPAKTRTTFKVEVLDSASPAPLKGFTVKACGLNDPPCAGPVDTQLSGDDGFAILTVDLVERLGWNGYVEVSGPNYVTTLSFPVLVLTGSNRVPYVRVTVPSVQLLNNIVTANQGTWDPGRGIILAFARDCELNAAPHVQFHINPEAIDDQSIQFYDRNGVPSRLPTETELHPTGAAGGWLNVKPGTANLTASLTSSGKVYSSASIYVRPGVLTISRAVPTP
jgi:hypothetical protein